MTFGGDPNAWWSMPPFRLAGFLLNRAKAEAYQSLRRVSELMAADPAYEQHGRQAQIDRWRTAAGFQKTEQPFMATLHALREMGLDVEVIH